MKSPSLSASPLVTKASGSLLSAALCGLLTLGAATACGDNQDTGVAPPHGTAGTSGEGGEGGEAGTPEGSAGAAGAAGATDTPTDDTYNNVISDGTPISAAEFQAMCDERNGWVYVTASCAGAGMCKGLSLLGDTLTDHSCKGMNSCGGAGCVVLPEDSGLSGKEIYVNGPCSGCHGDWTDEDHPNLGVYTVIHGTDISDADALERFKMSTDQRLLSIAIFGTQGLHADGTPYSNMPAYYQKYSLAEIKRAVTYAQSLPTEVSTYDIFGTTPGFGIPEAGAGGESAAVGGTGGASGGGAGGTNGGTGGTSGGTGGSGG